MTLVRNKNALRQAIHEAMLKYGPACDLNHLDIGRLHDLSFLFQVFPTFCGDISQWNTSNVRSMECLFDSCQFNGDISKWNTSNVTNMSGMFTYSKFNGDISGWNVSQVHSMSFMFAKSNFQGDLSSWNVGEVVNFRQIFWGALFSGDISNWTVHPSAHVKEFMSPKSQMSCPAVVLEKLSEVYPLKAELDKYLSSHRMPLTEHHVRRALEKNSKPPFLSPDQWNRLHTHESVCLALGLSEDDMLKQLLTHLQQVPLTEHVHQELEGVFHDATTAY